MTLVTSFLENCVLGLSTPSPRTSGRGISTAAGSSLLGGVATVGRSSQATKAVTSWRSWQEESVSGRLVALVGQLGSVALTSLRTGATKEFSSVENGEGIETVVSKPSLSEAGDICDIWA